MLIIHFKYFYVYLLPLIYLVTYSADKGRLHLIITDNLCQITVSNAMKKDNGRWNLYVGVGRGFFERKNIIYEVSVSGNLKSVDN